MRKDSNVGVSGVGNTDVYMTNSDVNGNINLLVNSSTYGVGTTALVINGSTGIVTGPKGIIANNSALLNSLSSTQFMRTDTNTSTSGNLSVQGNINTPVSITALGNVYGSNLLGNYLTVSHDATIYGNLSVTGNVTFTNSNVVTTNDLYISLANNQTTFAGINGAGLEAGPIGSPLTYWTYSTPTNSWVTNVNVAASGNITAANFLGNINLPVGGNIATSGSISASQFIGNGSQLSSINGANVFGIVGQASQLTTADFTVGESGGKLYFFFRGTPVASLDSAGDFTAAGDLSAYTAP